MPPHSRLRFRSPTWQLSVAGAGFLNVSLLLPSIAAAEPTPSAQTKADAALKILQARVPGTSSELPRLRKDLLAFRLAHPATRASLRAAALQLPGRGPESKARMRR